jgi:hypothetical protein
MRPPTHDDPNAIPRNGTDVPWLDLDDPSRSPARRNGARPAEGAASAAERQRRR